MSDARSNPIGKISIVALIVLSLAIIALTFTAITGRGFWGENRDAEQVIQSSSLNKSSDNWYRLYFSNPEDPEARTWRNGPDGPLAEAIKNARLSVDIAAYDLDLWSLREALLSAHRGGVTVRLVIDSDNQNKPEIQALIQGGIPVRGDLREGLMHNKFVIIDQMEVWTGSMNYTINGAYRNNNNLIGIRSPQLAEDYLSEFEEMFHDDLFGLGSPANTPYPHLFQDGASLEIYFSPEDGTAARLEQLIGNAQESIDFLAYAFTSDDLAEAMIERAKDGVIVSGVIETSQCTASRGCEYDRMKSSGVRVRLDGNPNEMHHKVIVIDHQVVVTGSYNFSASAETRNDENTLILDDADIAAQYLVEFTKIFDQATP
jgi:phosphatidylserine/phosphatidylglycerophosphate/cardiolipin synthase-like enzyme